jgi:hypothetical protein
LSSSRPELIEPISAPAVWDSRTASLPWAGTGLTKSEVNTNNKLLNKNPVFSRGNELNKKKDFSLRTQTRGAGAVGPQREQVLPSLAVAKARRARSRSERTGGIYEWS